MEERYRRAEAKAIASSGGLHYDSGKPRVDLLPTQSLLEISKVFGYGAKKYTDRNWELGIDQSRLYASTLRHLFAWMGGQDIDEESGRLHLAHAGCDILMLLHHALNDIKDDRPEVKNDSDVDVDDSGDVRILPAPVLHDFPINPT